MRIKGLNFQFVGKYKHQDVITLLDDKTLENGVYLLYEENYLRYVFTLENVRKILDLKKLEEYYKYYLYRNEEHNYQETYQLLSLEFKDRLYNKTIHKNPSIDMVRVYIRSFIDSNELPIDISSKEIHERLFMKNAYPTVCQAMRTLGDNYEYQVIQSPPKGNGSRLIHRYKKKNC